jgi:hypothetical protein
MSTYMKRINETFTEEEFEELSNYNDIGRNKRRGVIKHDTKRRKYLNVSRTRKRTP